MQTTSKEGQLREQLVEQEELFEVHITQKISENNHISRRREKVIMLEGVLAKDNIELAVKQVKRNKGASGKDGMTVYELDTYLKSNWSKIEEEILKGKYKPNPVREVEIPKEEKGKVRRLGIPTVVDRVIQQAIAQKLTPVFDKGFDDKSYGFRPRRSAKDAIKECEGKIKEGYVYVVDMDLEKYFDTVNHSKLIQLLSETVEDGRVISLIHKYLRAGVIVSHRFEEREKGTPQGGPLSPLLSNIYLNELDKELRRRNHPFVRYADDVMIFCKSKKAAERTLEKIRPYVEGKMFLKINEAKTQARKIDGVRFLGYTFKELWGK